MLQWNQRVYINETDSSYGCPMDQYEVTTYIGRHITSCEVRMCGETHSTSLVMKGVVRRFKDYNILHQEALFKDLRDDTGTYMELEYDQDEDLHWLKYDVVDSYELGHKATKRAAYRFRAFKPEGTSVTQHVLEVYACGRKHKQVIVWPERDEALMHLLNVALHDDGWSSCECANVNDMGFVADVA